MRRALAAAAAAAAALASAQHLPLPGLPYAYDALEPYIDAATMRTHHLGHMKAYTDRVNAAIGELRADPATNALAKNGLEWLLQHLDLVPEPQRGAIANHGGGYVNHELFFAQLAPARGNASSSAAAASGEGDDGDDEGAPAPGWGGDFSLTDGTHFQAAFLERFVSLPIFKELVRTAALRLFGSGWVWLELDARGAVPVLAVTTTPNQDTPLTDPRRLPLLGVDVWEHAYCEFGGAGGGGGHGTPPWGGLGGGGSAGVGVRAGWAGRRGGSSGRSRVIAATRWLRRS